MKSLEDELKEDPEKGSLAKSGVPQSQFQVIPDYDKGRTDPPSIAGLCGQENPENDNSARSKP